MRLLPLVLRHMRRTWVRTGSTMAAMGLCVFLFCTLESGLAQLDRVIEGRSPRRLVVRNGVSLMLGLPISYRERIAVVPGVKRVATTLIFGGLLAARKEGTADTGGGTDWTSVFSTVAVDAEPYFAMSPELMVAPGQFQEFLGDRQGCVMGRQLAAKFGWRVGDHFFLESFVAGLRKPSGPFEFVIRGLIDTDPVRYPATETNMMFFHYQYLRDNLAITGTPMYTVEIDDPDRAVETADAIDAIFENAGSPTFTESEMAFTSNFMSVTGSLAAILYGIGVGVCFTMLLVCANTLSMAARERRTEIAVLKTLGFASGQVMGLLVGEAVLMGAMGGLLGVAAAQSFLWGFTHTAGKTLFGLPEVAMNPAVALAGIGAATGLSLLAGLLPAWGAYRVRIAETLRSN